MTTFSKKYEPEIFEKEVYKIWENKGMFLPKAGSTGKTYYIPMPPPNVTGQLHLGHSLFLTLQDIMTRYHRMIGDETLWLPGTDHASISTQNVIEKKLAAEGKTRYDLGREKFIELAWDWTKEYGGTITHQMRQMGASCDWSREKFTFEEGQNKKVIAAFVDLYKKGLIYKGDYMVNFSPKLNTVVSDQEVIYKEEKGKLYYITYFVAGSDNEIVVATTRPETMLGDVAVAVNPNDKRYKKILKAKKTLILPILNKEIPLIADEMVDMEFGTGAVKITPAHDKNDFEVGKRHNLPLDNIVLGKDGNMTSEAGIFAGQDFLTARENIVELLKAKGNLLKVEDYTHKVGYCERSGCKIETIISSQWFVKIEPIVKKVIDGYKKKEFEIIPNRFNKIFEDWIYNLRDWCISRQLWRGHRIPAYYHKVTGEILITEEDMSGNPDYIQDEDTLDTWFSSALWPFATLDFNIGNKLQISEDFKKFYPAQMLETGHDIIFFWVIRMLLFGYEFTGETPFKKVYLHGLIKDKLGRKFSKSLGNGIDPLEMIEKYSADALRLGVSIGNTPGNDLKFDESNVEENKIFINKLWNATRFVYTNLFEKGEYKLDKIDKIEERLLKNYEKLSFSEKWILSKLRNLSDFVNKSMEEYNFSECGIELINFTKNDFCDYYIEEFKLFGNKSDFGNDVIIYVINNILKLWHPFIPFVTEELYGKLGFEGMLINASFSKVALKSDKEIEKQKEIIIEVITEIRRIRADNNIMPNKSINLLLKPKKGVAEIFDEEVIFLISGIVKSENSEVIDKKPDEENLVYAITKAGVEIFVDNSNAMDVEKEIERLKAQIDDTKEYITIIDRKLLNDSFVRNAPASLVRSEMEKKEQAREKLVKLEEKLGKLK